ncbi:hypothetical protein RHS01_01365 [Rhizoctonia solani]|uniref:DUF7137 domain-containing protein n=1 Tax=Rhizoctonia solani TaxID=456999 RepID=A0A8H7IKC4_9AGAM|nr:hypothetical protein RHS01_01365 [Rhizoctonia solani]
MDTPTPLDDGISRNCRGRDPWDGYTGADEVCVWMLINSSLSKAPTLQPETYTLRIFDERGWTVAAAPGLLNANQNLKFAMYTPAAYTPLESGWRCVTCSAATPNISSPSFMALGMTMIVMLISGIGLLRGLIRNW